jgi:hypothetical protein
MSFPFKLYHLLLHDLVHQVDGVLLELDSSVHHGVNEGWKHHFVTLDQRLRVCNEDFKTKRQNVCGPLGSC